MRHRLSVGSASALSCGGEKYVRSGRTGEGQAGGCGREKEDDTKSAENVSRGVLPSRQSLLDLVSGKFMGRHTPTHHYYHQQQQQVGYRDLTWLKYSFCYHTRREKMSWHFARAHWTLDIGPRMSLSANLIFWRIIWQFHLRWENWSLTRKDRGKNIFLPLLLAFHISTFSVTKSTDF